MGGDGKGKLTDHQSSALLDVVDSIGSDRGDSGAFTDCVEAVRVIKLDLVPLLLGIFAVQINVDIGSVDFTSNVLNHQAQSAHVPDAQKKDKPSSCLH